VPDEAIMPAAPPLRSNWTVLGLMAKLPGFRRVDPGGDPLAFRLAGGLPGRMVTIRLSVQEPTVIAFDLEDRYAVRPAWDEGCEHGTVDSVGDLALVLRHWLVAPN
jgi:hypothetical protein